MKFVVGMKLAFTVGFIVSGVIGGSVTVIDHRMIPVLSGLLTDTSDPDTIALAKVIWVAMWTTIVYVSFLHLPSAIRQAKEQIDS